VTELFPDSCSILNFHAMGSEITVWLETPDSESATTTLAQVKTLFEDNEQALSRFRADSELSQLNAQSGKWVTVSDLLWDVLTLALEMAAITDGRFDPTTLNALEQHGYTVSFEQLVKKSENNLAQSQNPVLFPGRWADVRLDERRHAVSLPAGVRVDLGGIAKGYTAQQAVSMLWERGPCLVDAGGDLVAGSAPQDCPGWPVAISSPWISETVAPPDMFTLWIANEALATSGIDYRNWQRDGRLMHHLIDPTSGAPSETDGLTATILADNAAVAEAWATATMVAGSSLGMEMLLAAGLGGLMVTQSGAVLATPLMQQRLNPLPIQLALSEETIANYQAELPRGYSQDHALICKNK
jgi:FAD:protein FMN transferase